MYQAYMYNGAIWILQSVDPSTRKFVLQLLGGNKVITVDPSEVKLVDVQQFSEQLQLQVEKHTELLAIDTDKVSDKRKEKARERFDAITLEVSGEIDAVKAAAIGTRIMPIHARRRDQVLDRSYSLGQCRLESPSALNQRSTCRCEKMFCIGTDAGSVPQ